MIKFGAASLEDPRRAIEYVAATALVGREVVVVVSARAGITDALLSFVEGPRREGEADALLAALARRHAPLERQVGSCLGSLRRRLRSLDRAPGTVDRSRDGVLAYGERISARWFAGLLRSEGHPAVAIDADRAGLTGRADESGTRIDLDRSDQPLRDALRCLLSRGTLPVVTGFLARDATGGTCTLGRGGSDASATAIGAVLSAARVELVKVGHPVLAADPTIVPDARCIPRLSYREADLLAGSGARVLHWDVARLAAERGLEVHVVSLADPSRRTVIGPREPGGRIGAVAWRQVLPDAPVRGRDRARAPLRATGVVTVVAHGIGRTQGQWPSDLARWFDESDSGPDRVKFVVPAQEIASVVRSSYDLFIRAREDLPIPEHGQEGAAPMLPSLGPDAPGVRTLIGPTNAPRSAVPGPTPSPAGE